MGKRSLCNLCLKICPKDCTSAADALNPSPTRRNSRIWTGDADLQSVFTAQSTGDG